jgi:hypothetical protein
MAVAVLWPAPVDGAKLPGGFSISDLLVSHWPSAAIIKQTVARDHRLPLWNPAYGGGRPLAADPLAALFYPPTHLVHFFRVRDYLLLMFLGHLILAGAGMRVLARRALGLPPLAALVAALAFEATPRLIAHLGVGHLTMVQAAAWLPWVAFTCWATVRHPARWAVPLGGCMALLLLAGHPQLAYYGMLLVAALVFWLVVARWRAAGGQAALASVAGLAAAASLALALAAVHLLPLLEFMAHSTRQRAVRATDAIHLWSFLKNLASVRESTANTHEGIFEPGLAVLALAVLGVAARWRAAAPILLGVVLVAGLALGNSSPIYLAAARLLPGFDRFRGLGRIWFLALPGIALLAGLGAECVIRAARRVHRQAGIVVGLLCILLVSTNLLRADRGLTHVEDVSSATKTSAMERAAGLIAGHWRIYGAQRNMRQVNAAAQGRRLADGWDPLLIEPYVSFMQRAGSYTFPSYQLSVPPFEVYDPGYPTSQEAQPDAGLLGLVDVAVVLSRIPLRDPRLILVTKLDNTFIYRNAANAGPAYLVAPASGGQPPAIANLRRLDAAIVARDQGPERLNVSMSSTHGGFLVVGSPAYPGWVAELDGQPVALTTIEGVLPAIPVGPGTHHLTYRYAPATVRWGAALSLAGGIAGLAWLVWSALRARRTSYKRGGASTVA